MEFDPNVAKSAIKSVCKVHSNNYAIHPLQLLIARYPNDERNIILVATGIGQCFAGREMTRINISGGPSTSFSQFMPQPAITYPGRFLIPVNDSDVSLITANSMGPASATDTEYLVVNPLYCAHSYVKHDDVFHYYYSPEQVFAMAEAATLFHVHYADQRVKSNVADYCDENMPMYGILNKIKMAATTMMDNAPGIEWVTEAMKEIASEYQRILEQPTSLGVQPTVTRPNLSKSFESIISKNIEALMKLANLDIPQW